MTPIKANFSLCHSWLSLSIYITNFKKYTTTKLLRIKRRFRVFLVNVLSGQLRTKQKSHLLVQKRPFWPVCIWLQRNVSAFCYKKKNILNYKGNLIQFTIDESIYWQVFNWEYYIHRNSVCLKAPETLFFLHVKISKAILYSKQNKKSFG